MQIKKDKKGMRNLDGADLNKLFLGESSGPQDLTAETQAIREKSISDIDETSVKQKRLKLSHRILKLKEHDLHTLDLHRKFKSDVEPLVREFILAGRRYNNEFVLIITGRGNRSENGSVLKPEVKKQLDGYIKKGIIKSYHTAPPNLGGEGAFLVVLS